jgi:hypothetical protein
MKMNVNVAVKVVRTILSTGVMFHGYTHVIGMEIHKFRHAMFIPLI